MKKGTKRVMRFALLGLLVVLMGVILASGGADYLSLHVLAENRAELAAYVATNFWQAVVIFMLVYAGAVALSVPGGAVLTIGGGFLFGIWLGVFLVVIAATIGAIILFLIAKTTLGESLARRAGDALTKLQAGFRENAFNYLLFLRLVPLFPFWLVNLAPALLGVSLPVYATATFIGIIPGSFAFAFLGTGLESILVKQQKIYALCMKKTPMADCTATPNVGDLITTEILLSLSVLGLVALIPIFYQKFFGKQS